MVRKTFILFAASLFLTGCFEKSTNDSVQTYEYWAEAKPPADMELLNGQYWQSALWTKEYILYLKFKPTKEWVAAFLLKNGWLEDKTEWEKPEDAPSWFIPLENYMKFKTGDFSGSTFFYDLETGICYLYEFQL